MQSMLQACPAIDCQVSCHHEQRFRPEANRVEDVNSVVVDVGQVDQQVAALWWALAQQTARVARRCSPSGGVIRPTSDWNAAWAPMTSLSSRRSPEPLDLIPDCSPSTCTVQQLTLSCLDTSDSSGSAGPDAPATSRYSETMSSTTPMSSPRLVREMAEKFPPTGQRPASAARQSYTYETPESKADGVQLLSYVRTPHNTSADQLNPEGTLLRGGSMRRPKSEVAIRPKFSDSTGQLQHLDDAASSSVDCVQYESQDLGRDTEDDPSLSGYSPIVVVVSFFNIISNDTRISFHFGNQIGD